MDNDTISGAGGSSAVPVGRNSVVTVGTFDGVHRGHRAVLSTLRAEAKAGGLRPLAITFDCHPLQVIAPRRAPKMICGGEERDAMLRDEGVDVEQVCFDDSLRRLTCADWMRRLRDEWGMKRLVVGYDNTFGSDGVNMQVEDYRRLGAELGVEVVEAPKVEGCSSSAVRRAVAEGRLDYAALMLGRPFSVTGTVVHGRHLGRTIGAPTANVSLPAERLLPPDGVYAAVAVTADGERRRAVANVGMAPTVGVGETRVEVHIPGFDGDLYGQVMTVEFLKFIRPERRFSSLAALRAAITADIAAASTY